MKRSSRAADSKEKEQAQGAAVRATRCKVHVLQCTSEASYVSPVWMPEVRLPPPLTETSHPSGRIVLSSASAE